MWSGGYRILKRAAVLAFGILTEDSQNEIRDIFSSRKKKDIEQGKESTYRIILPAQKGGIRNKTTGKGLEGISNYLNDIKNRSCLMTAERRRSNEDFT